MGRRVKNPVEFKKIADFLEALARLTPGESTSVGDRTIELVQQSNRCRIALFSVTAEASIHGESMERSDT